MKRLLQFGIAIKRGGASLQDRMDKERKPYIFVGLVCVREKYQRQGYMRKVLDIAFAEGDRLGVPVILETDAKNKFRCSVGVMLMLHRFFCVKIIFDNVDFQLFLTQILYLNSKRVKIGGEQELSTSQAAKNLELTPTSISRASRQLEEKGLLHIRKVGVQRIMQSEDSPKTLFQKAGDKLLNPIKRTVYIPKELVGTELLESGYSALAEYSMLNAPNVRCYAAERISQWKDVMTNSLQNSQVQVAVEMWRYNPRKLSTRNIVDELSLALALREDADERVEEAVEEMLNELWRKIDSYRN